MPLHALEDIDDALDVTRAFLWPVDRTRWLKLAVVVFFVGGPGANLNSFQFTVPTDGGTPSGPGPLPPEVEANLLFAVVAVVALALLLGLGFLLVGSVMEFVLIESLRHETVALRRYWGERWRQGLRLFGFRLVVGSLVLGSVAVLAVLVLLPVVVEAGPGPDGAAGLSVIGFLLLLPVVVVLAVLVGLLNGFTTVFVVPIMVLEGGGVLKGWGRLWPTITGNVWQYLAYAVVGAVLNVVGGLLAAIATGVILLVLLIPFGLLAAIGAALLAVAPPLGLGVLAVVALVFGATLLVVASLVQMPVVTYLRYYALLVLGDIAPELDLLPERRAAVRADGE